MSSLAQRDLKRKLDQFYTDTSYAKNFFQIIKTHINIDSADILLEPSAGNGSFLNLFDLEKRVGIDIMPMSENIQQCDFFEWEPPTNKRIITIGNPPFGKNSNLAIKFFNKAAEFSDAIAFILPKTFRKDRTQNRLDGNFHLLYDEDVPKNSFIFDEEPYDVWCCAQIWEKSNKKRHKNTIYNFSMVESWFVKTDAQHADFAIQRVGARAGLIRTTDFEKYSEQSHYFLKQKNAVVLPIFEQIDFNTVKFNTVGNPSISPNELIKSWIEIAKNSGIII